MHERVLNLEAQYVECQAFSLLLNLKILCHLHPITPSLTQAQKSAVGKESVESIFAFCIPPCPTYFPRSGGRRERRGKGGIKVFLHVMAP